ncbi:MAG TPA: hypothetical protein VGN16_07820 [Acidobacteriaceae bacterium]|jgi:hypothetical protein
MNEDTDDEFKRMQRWLGAHNESKPEEGLTVEQTRTFGERGGWILGYLVAVILALSVLAFAASRADAAAPPNTATITFSAVTTYTDGTAIAGPVTYNVYQGAKGSTAKVKVGTITTINTSVSSGLLTGQEYCFEVTAVAGGVEGDHSNEGCKKFIGTPGTVVITVT